MDMKPLLLQILAAFSRKCPLPDSLLRYLYSPDRRQHDFFETIIPYDGDLKIQISTQSFFEWEILFKGYYEKHLVDTIKRFVKPGDVCVDVGANVGTNTLIMAKCAGPDGMVWAFEPHRGFFRRLEENLRLNSIRNVKLFMKALDCTDGRTTLFVADAAVKTASMVPFDPGYSDKVTIETISPETALGSLTRCDFVKIDVDGTEGRILDACRDLLERFSPCVVFEFSDVAWARDGWTLERAEKLLMDCGYRLHLLEVDGSLVPLAKPLSFGNIFACPLSRGSPPSSSQTRAA